jgi:hypothetical protein
MLRRVVWWKFTDVSEVLATSIVRASSSGTVPDDRGSKHIWSIRKILPHCTAQCFLLGPWPHWLPGSEAADAAAKAAALHGTLGSGRTVGSDVRTLLHRAILSSWQDEWDNAQRNKLRMVKPCVQVWQSSFSVVRKAEVSLTRFRIGHTLLTHIHLLRGEAAPVCRNCGVPLNVARILVDCPRYAEARRIYHLHEALSDMLGDDRFSVSNVLAFINVIGFSTSI